MTNTHRCVLAALVGLTLSAHVSSTAQSGPQAARVPLYISFSGDEDDRASERFVSELREAIRSSSGYSLTTTERAAKIRLEIASVRNPCGNTQRGAAAVAIISLPRRALLRLETLNLDVDTAAELARDVLAVADQTITDARKR